jgi:uncharacterized protein YxjI
MSGWNPAAVGIMNAMTNQGILLMKMKMLSLGKNYDIMDKDQRVLATIGLDANQNMTGAVVGAAVASIAGDYVGRFAKRSLSYTYDVKDAAGNLALQIRKGSGGNKTQFTIVDPATGATAGTIDMKRSLFGGLKAFWVAPTGQPLMGTKGNIIRRKYAITNPSGVEIGRVRHKMLAIRDVWELDLNPGTNHLYSAIFAVILDFEKKM